MGHVSAGRCVPLALILFAATATADTTPPQLVSLSVSPLSADTSSGPATLTIAITARDDNNGFDTSSTGNGRIVFSNESATSVFGRQSLPITGGTSTNPVFQFTLSVPQSSPAGTYRISLTLVDNAFNSVTFSSSDLQARGFPSSIAVTQNGFGSVTLSPPAANITASAQSGLLQVAASSSALSWIAASNAAWLMITSGASGTGNGSVTYLAAQNNSPSPRTAVITVSGQTFTLAQAAAGSSLNTTGGSMLFAYQVGGAAPPPQTITAFSSGAPLNFTAVAASAGNWLFVSPISGVTSTILSIFINPTALTPGTYTGSVTVSASGSSNGSQTEVVTLIVSAGSTMTITPAALSFFYQQGSSNPPPQTLSVASGAAAGFTASASSAGSWLAVNPLSGTTPSTLAVSVLPPGLAAGNYSGSVTIVAATGTQMSQ
jgi:hypothetical protein